MEIIVPQYVQNGTPGVYLKDMVCTQFETLTHSICHSSLNSPSGKWLSLNKSDIVHQVLNTAISVEHDRLMKIPAQKMRESPTELCS